MDEVQIILTVFVAIFIIITAIAMVYSSKKRGMEIVLKKPFFKGKHVVNNPSGFLCIVCRKTKA